MDLWGSEIKLAIVVAPSHVEPYLVIPGICGGNFFPRVFQGRQVILDFFDLWAHGDECVWVESGGRSRRSGGVLIATQGKSKECTTCREKI